MKENGFEGSFLAPHFGCKSGPQRGGLRGIYIYKKIFMHVGIRGYLYISTHIHIYICIRQLFTRERERQREREIERK